MIKITLSFLLLASVTFLQASVSPTAIPRTPIKHYQTEGIFEGGTHSPANIEAVRFSPHQKDGYERWVIDFSDQKQRVIGKIAPLFQIRYVKAHRLAIPDAKDIVLEPAKFVFIFREIQHNYLNSAALKTLTKKSRFVKDIVLYPAIEDGDTAIELVLNDNVLFEPHQPTEKAGRLVLDLKNAPLDQ